MNNKISHTATIVIVAASASISNASANLIPDHTSLDPTYITQESCDARFDLTPDGLIKRHAAVASDKLWERGILITDDWPSGLLDLLDELNESDFEEGNLTIVDCIGSSNNIHVRSRDFELDNLDRQGNEERGWRFSAEANRREEGVLRLLRLELPPNYEWEINSTGDGIIATQALFHQLNFRINEEPGDGPELISQIGVNSSAPDSVFPDQLRQDGVRYNRIRVTEIKRIGESLQFSQLVTTNAVSYTHLTLPTKA